ncbi:probable serine/threonine-protein kinase PBL28 isoform X2 [Macadamia integrifolia]|uniref:probable serine/threonine-protein kinase PBL28 isoform X2 n=1 Tax=Macadamia integrifolia TaxID=60698 RepID=UPI001C4F972D|nr:probable serine/threonine-protein kinase PBL28 isoform X2 [Macadamia integrifolia]
MSLIFNLFISPNGCLQWLWIIDPMLGLWKEAESSYQMSRSNAPIVVGAVGGLALIMLVIVLVWFYMLQCKNSNKNSETGSSDPSTLVTVDWNRRAGSSTVGGPHISGPQEGKQFMLDKLEHATKQFSESNVIGHGSFGLVYKGLLRDGTVIAVKRRPGPSRQEFVEGAYYLSEIRHRNLVSLLGYCQEDGSQMLVYEYLPNGNVCGHLYDTGQGSQLEFKQRLSIALGAAKGLCHLHSLRPPLVHKNFKTANVLVDESFMAKVADAGVSELLERIEDAGPSSRSMDGDVFQDPEKGESRLFSEKSDVYSFGIFLLELITGQEALRINQGSNESLNQWVESLASSDNLVDNRLAGTFTLESMKNLINLASWCMNLAGKVRPKMEMVVTLLDRILENERTMTTVMGEGTATVTLGSQLFT